MNNFNKKQNLYCQYCNKECKSLNSLKQHECRCKQNPNKINLSYNHIGHKTINGYKWMNNGIKSKCIKPEEIDIYINNGWKFGMHNELKEIIAKSLKGKIRGIASTPKKELLRKQKISESMKGNTNWMYNKTRGNGKKGWYHNIFCDSAWELAYLVYHIEHELNIKRCNKKLEYIWNNEKHIYIPDFETDEGIIEIKGRKTKKSEAKHKQYPNIKIIDYKLIIPYLTYVENKYGKEYWKILYEKK